MDITTLSELEVRNCPKCKHSTLCLPVPTRWEGFQCLTCGCTFQKTEVNMIVED